MFRSYPLVFLACLCSELFRFQILRNCIEGWSAESTAGSGRNLSLSSNNPVTGGICSGLCRSKRKKSGHPAKNGRAKLPVRVCSHHSRWERSVASSAVAVLLGSNLSHRTAYLNHINSILMGAIIIFVREVSPTALIRKLQKWVVRMSGTDSSDGDWILVGEVTDRYRSRQLNQRTMFFGFAGTISRFRNHLILENNERYHWSECALW